VLAAARTVFAREGLTAPIPAIAKHAGVAPQTVYAIFGNKGGLLRDLVDLVDTEAGRPELIAGLRAASGDPARQIALVVDFDLRLFERSGDLIGLAHGTQATHPEAAELVRSGRERGRRGRRPLVESWQAAGLLRDELTVDEAIDGFLALCSYDLYRLLVIEAGWTLQRYASWVNRTACLALVK
jgi:AcrR family transcriptional regulator